MDKEEEQVQFIGCNATEEDDLPTQEELYAEFEMEYNLENEQRCATPSLAELYAEVSGFLYTEN